MRNTILRSLGFICLILFSNATFQAQKTIKQQPLMIAKQGSFAVGGSVIKNPGTFNPQKPTAEGQTFSGDHAYIFYQIPVKARKYSLVMWHGIGQFSKTWETTPDGREGYQNIFLRRNFPVYIMDQPRRGNAGRSTVSSKIDPIPDEQQWFNVFRVGIWPDYYDGVQFAHDPEALNQYFRAMVPNIGGIDIKVNTDAASALFDKIGSGVLVTHSHSGGMGWLTAIKNKNVKGIVSYEPGSGFVFPAGELPQPIASSAGALEASSISKEDFLKLTKYRLLFIMETTFLKNHQTIPVLTDGEHVFRWQDCGEMPSINMVAT